MPFVVHYAPRSAARCVCFRYHSAGLSGATGGPTDDATGDSIYYKFAGGEIVPLLGAAVQTNIDNAANRDGIVRVSYSLQCGSPLRVLLLDLRTWEFRGGVRCRWGAPQVGVDVTHCAPWYNSYSP